MLDHQNLLFLVIGSAICLTLCQWGHTASFKIGVSKVQDFGNLVVGYARAHCFAPPLVVIGMSQKLSKVFGFAMECQRLHNIVSYTCIHFNGAPLLLNFTLYALTYSIEVKIDR